MADATRENWGTRLGFILAAVGSAVGLGNIWRFPGVAYENGGGAFLVPYLVALLTAGIPLLIMEFTIGRKYRASAPLAWRKLSKGAEFIGWWQTIIASVIAVYYAAIVAWAAWYTWFSIDQSWGSADETGGFLFDFLGADMATGLFDFSGYSQQVLWGMVAVWLIVGVVIVAGVRKGIERFNKIFMPLLIVMFGVMVVQALTLEGAATGLNAFFTPEWSELSNADVWIAAYGQIFFSLSIGFGIMITYASYLKKKNDITTSALTVGFANSSFELLAGIGVFSVLGFMAVQSGTPVDEQVSSGVGLAFVAFPAIINQLPFAPALFGILFFLSLTFAGLTSLISIVQVPAAAIKDRFGVSQKAAAGVVWAVLAVISVSLFSANNGLFMLDSTDAYINAFGIAGAGFTSILVVFWIVRKWPVIVENANSSSTFQLVKRRKDLWFGALGVVTVLILGVTLYQSVQAQFQVEWAMEYFGLEDAETAQPFVDYGIVLVLSALGLAVLLNIVLLGYKSKGEEITSDDDDDDDGAAPAAEASEEESGPSEEKAESAEEPEDESGEDSDDGSDGDSEEKREEAK
ncbi:sodium-dependent transporter [Salininema proteolyticum]|uniref:Sodium-dependent transporter n=1 Tax=Salininema proteolyticum TaxID=1607685 RepID=A0ABV8U0Z1_9ACTN